jgi:8-oxo-dGTP diphosphatase
MNKDKYKRINVAGLIINNQKELLLTQRAKTKKYLPNKWHIPGGKVEQDESLSTALEREIKEELSLTVLKKKRLSSTFVYQEGKDLYCTKFYFIETNGKVKLNSENQAYEYVPIEKLGEYLNGVSFKPSKSAFQEALKID